MKKFRISDHKFHGRHVHHTPPALAEANNAGVFSCHRSYRSDKAIPRILLEAAARRLLTESGSTVAVEGIIPGHLKLLLKSGQAGMVLSMTRPEAVDASSFGGWADLDRISEYEVTVNFLLLEQNSFDVETVLGVLEPQTIVSV